MRIENKILSESGSSVDDEQKLKEFELSMAIKIPNELRDLIKKGKIVFEKKTFLRIVDESFKQEMTLESIFSINEIIKGMDFMSDEEEFIKNKLLLFGETLGSPIVCIGVGKNNYGFVYVFDWDFGITKISDSFAQFVNSLKSNKTT